MAYIPMYIHIHIYAFFSVKVYSLKYDRGPEHDLRTIP